MLLSNIKHFTSSQQNHRIVFYGQNDKLFSSNLKLKIDIFHGLYDEKKLPVATGDFFFKLVSLSVVSEPPAASGLLSYSETEHNHSVSESHLRLTVYLSICVFVALGSKLG